MKFAKIRDVKSPIRSTSRAGGIDFYVPEFSPEFVNALYEKNSSNRKYCDSDDTDGFYLHEHSHILIPSGIVMNLQSVKFAAYTDYMGVALVAHNKSSIGIKQLQVSAVVVDEDYQHETHLSVTNTSSKPVKIFFGQKLVQFLIVPILLDTPEETDFDKLFTNKTDRLGGFGSTGKV